MGLTSRLMNRAGWVRTNNNANGGLLHNEPDGWVANQETPFWYIGSDSFASIGQTGAAIAAAGRCTSLIADSIASLPLRLMRGRDQLPSPRWMTDPMLQRRDARFGDIPSEGGGRPTTLSRPEFFSQLMTCVIAQGNGYFLFRRDDNGQPMAPFLPINPLDVSINEGRYSINSAELSADGTIQLGAITYELFHTRAAGPYTDEGLGVGVLQRYGQTLLDANTLRNFAATSLSSGVPAGFLKVSNPNVSEPQMQALKTAWMNAHGNSTQSIAVLNAVTDFTPLQFSPVDAAVVDLLKMNMQDIALAFGVEPGMLGVSGDSNTYANVESRMLQFNQFTLLPYVRRLEASLTNLVPTGTDVQIDMRGLLRADTNTRNYSYSIGVQNGWLTPDEVRELEDLGPMPKELAAANALKLLGQSGQEIDGKQSGDKIQSDQKPRDRVQTTATEG